MLPVVQDDTGPYTAIGPQPTVEDRHGACKMAKELRCRDVGFDCDAVVVAENEEDVLRQVGQHARDVHDMSDEQLSDANFLQQVQNQIHEQEQPA